MTSAPPRHLRPRSRLRWLWAAAFVLLVVVWPVTPAAAKGGKAKPVGFGQPAASSSGRLTRTEKAEVVLALGVAVALLVWEVRVDRAQSGARHLTRSRQ